MGFRDSEKSSGLLSFMGFSLEGRFKLLSSYRKEHNPEKSGTWCLRDLWLSRLLGVSNNPVPHSVPVPIFWPGIHLELIKCWVP